MDSSQPHILTLMCGSQSHGTGTSSGSLSQKSTVSSRSGATRDQQQRPFLRRLVSRRPTQQESTMPSATTVIRVGPSSTTTPSECGTVAGGSMRRANCRFIDELIASLEELRKSTRSKTSTEHKSSAVFRTVVGVGLPGEAQPTVVEVAPVEPDNSSDVKQSTPSSPRPATQTIHTVPYDVHVIVDRPIASDSSSLSENSSANTSSPGKPLPNRRSRVLQNEQTVNVVEEFSAHPTDLIRQSSAGTPTIQLTRWRVHRDFDVHDTSGTTRRETQHETTGYREIGFQELHGAFPATTGPPMHHPELLYSALPVRFDEDSEQSSKGCCWNWQPQPSTVIRWFIAVISFLGLCCVIVGIVLGALTVSGTTRLTLCLLMIGVGVVLITVSGIAWRLTTVDPSLHPTCWGMLGFRTSPRMPIPPPPQFLRRERCSRRGMPPAPPMPGFVCPDFLWQPPPPSYQASMQEMRLQQRFTEAAPPPRSVLGSPPPTYHSRGSPAHRPALSEFIQMMSRPSSYQSDGSLLSANNSVTATNDAVASTDLVVGSDRQQLLTGSQFPVTQDGIANPVYDAGMQTSTGSTVIAVGSLRGPSSHTDHRDDRVSVIDCSRQTPVVFEVPDAGDQCGNTEVMLSAAQLQSPAAHRRRLDLPPRYSPPPSVFSAFRPVFPPPLRIPRPVCFIPDPCALSPLPGVFLPPPPRFSSGPLSRESLLSVTDFLEITGGPSYV